MAEILYHNLQTTNTKLDSHSIAQDSNAKLAVHYKLLVETSKTEAPKQNCNMPTIDDFFLENAGEMYFIELEREKRPPFKMMSLLDEPNPLQEYLMQVATRNLVKCECTLSYVRRHSE
jgi:hypothetical protein